MARDRSDAYDPSAFPAFAVTVDIVIFRLAPQGLDVLLVRRGGEPFLHQWALPGGFKHPEETLDEAASRELREETHVEAARLLRQFGAYGDPGRDPRLNVVTVAYLAVLPDPQETVAGTDAEFAGFRALGDALTERLAFDHGRILRDAVRRVRDDLERTGLATAFVPEQFTLSELRRVYEAIWGVELDQGNFRRSLLAETGWLVPTGRTAAPGVGGGKRAELFVAGPRWSIGGPIRRKASALGDS